jgi:Flp pilus assembly CpaF family ATPase
MLNCLVAAIPARERVVTCEEVFELPIATQLHRSAETVRKVVGPLRRRTR